MTELLSMDAPTRLDWPALIAMCQALDVPVTRPDEHGDMHLLRTRADLAAFETPASASTSPPPGGSMGRERRSAGNPPVGAAEDQARRPPSAGARGGTRGRAGFAYSTGSSPNHATEDQPTAD